MTSGVDTPYDSLKKRLLSRADAAESMIPLVGGLTTDAGRTFDTDAKLFRAVAEALSQLEHEIEDWRGRLATSCGETLAARSETKAWISVEDQKPHCPRDSMALGTPVLIWPRNPTTIRGCGVDGFAYYGKRATGHPTFYLHGAELHGVTHWQPLPGGPNG
jgi:Protein of unknown function (DUF551)